MTYRILFVFPRHRNYEDMQTPTNLGYVVVCTPERRKSTRRPVRGGVALDVRRVCSEYEPNLAQKLLNVSAEGIGIRLTVPVLPGDELQVNVCRADGSSLVKGLGEVRWCRPIGGGLFAAGLRLVRRLTLTELAELSANASVDSCPRLTRLPRHARQSVECAGTIRSMVSVGLSIALVKPFTRRCLIAQMELAHREKQLSLRVVGIG